jgi:hypothetical protein
VSLSALSCNFAISLSISTALNSSRSSSSSWPLAMAERRREVEDSMVQEVKLSNGPRLSPLLKKLSLFHCAKPGLGFEIEGVDEPRVVSFKESFGDEIENVASDYWIPVVATKWLSRIVSDIHYTEGLSVRIMTPEGSESVTSGG